MSNVRHLGLEGKPLFAVVLSWPCLHGFETAVGAFDFFIGSWEVRCVRNLGREGGELHRVLTEQQPVELQSSETCCTAVRDLMVAMDLTAKKELQMHR